MPYPYLALSNTTCPWPRISHPVPLSQTCCIYKTNGCPWKGKVNELAAHQLVCTFQVTSCPYGCGEKIDTKALRTHQKRCEFRPVNDCPCGKAFRYNQRHEHRQNCLAWHQQIVPSLRQARDAAATELSQRTEALRRLKLAGAEREAQVATTQLDKLGMILGMVGLVSCEARPDASVAVALFVLVAVQARQPVALRQGRYLVAASLLADLAWMLILGPRQDGFFGAQAATAAVEATQPQRPPPAASSSLDDAAPRPYTVGLVCALAALKAAVLLVLPQALGALEALRVAQLEFEEEGKTLEVREATRSRDGSIVATRLPPPASGGGGASTSSLSSLDEADPAARRGWPAVPRSGRQREPDRGPLGLWLDVLGWSTFAIALWGCICRPDAAAALALLVLTTVRESGLYFSRVLLGVAALALALDGVWLQQTMPDAAAALLGFNVPAFLALAAEEGSLRDYMAAWCVLLSFPCKLLLLLTGLHLSCLPLAVEAQPFRFEESDDAGLAGGGVTDSSPPTDRSSESSDRDRDRDRAAERETKSEKRRLARTREQQLQRAKESVTLCFLGLLLACACAPLRLSLTGMECYVFTMLAAYSCLRHSHVCASRPVRCRAMLERNVLLLLLSFVLEARVLLDQQSLLEQWGGLSLTGKVSLASSVADVLLLLVLLHALLRLLPTLQVPTHVSGTARRLWASRTHYAAAASFCLAVCVSSLRRDVDTALFALALFASSEDAEAASRAALQPTGSAAAAAAAAALAAAPDAASSSSLAATAAAAAAAAAAPTTSAAPLACLRPDPARRPGGLLTAVLLAALTGAADLTWVVPQLRGGPSLQATSAAELFLVLLKLAAKLAFGLSAARLLATRRAPSRLELAADERGSFLYTASCMLLVSACVANASSTLLSDEWLGEWLFAESYAPAAALDASHEAAVALALGVAAGPTAVLAAAGCAVALGSGGRRGGALLISSALALLCVDCVWLVAGPLALGWEDVARLRELGIPGRWQLLPPPLVGAASTLLLQVPLKLTIAVATAYYAGGPLAGAAGGGASLYAGERKERKPRKGSGDERSGSYSALTTAAPPRPRMPVGASTLFALNEEDESRAAGRSSSNSTVPPPPANAFELQL